MAYAKVGTNGRQWRAPSSFLAALHQDDGPYIRRLFFSYACRLAELQPFTYTSLLRVGTNTYVHTQREREKKEKTGACLIVPVQGLGSSIGSQGPIETYTGLVSRRSDGRRIQMRVSGWVALVGYRQSTAVLEVGITLPTFVTESYLGRGAQKCMETSNAFDSGNRLVVRILDGSPRLMDASPLWPRYMGLAAWLPISKWVRYQGIFPIPGSAY